MLNLNHKRLDTWKLSIDFIEMIYSITDKFPSSELFGLTSQLRRAAVSVSSNIAEGSSRSSSKDRKRFFEMARSSLVEIDTQFAIAVRLNFVDQDTLNSLDELLNKLFAMLTNLGVKT
ncbi:MAG: four helix bundle protein [Balneolaceae bacterium]|nr:four helix bundle protein [Balneolaceae bacterium]